MKVLQSSWPLKTTNRYLSIGERIQYFFVDLFVKRFGFSLYFVAETADETEILERLNAELEKSKVHQGRFDFISPWRSGTGNAQLSLYGSTK